MREKIITSRKWHNPEIETFITTAEVGASISLDDFIEAVVADIGNPTMLLTKAALKAKLEEASARVLHEMKLATTHVV